MPTVADGLVFVGTANSLVVFGLLAPPSGPPAAPSNIAATAPAFNTVNVTWQDNANNESSYLIERTSTPDAPSSWVQIGTASANATMYADTTVQAETTYYYRVRAYNSYNGGSYSAYVTLVAGITTPEPPPQGTGDGAYAEYWTNIPAGTPAFPFTGPPTLTRVDPTIDFNWGTSSPDPSISTDHFGVVWTGRILAQYSESYTFSAYVNDGVMLKISPAGTNTWTTIINNWNNGGYATTSGSYNMLAGQQYDFEMDMFEDTNQAGAHLSWSSLPSTPLQIIPQLQLYSGSAPAAPTGLTLTPQASYEVDLAWTDNSNIETGYEVQRMDPGGSFATIALLPPNSTSYIDTELFAGVDYSYRVRALNFAADSDFSNVASVGTPVPPAAPSEAHATGVTQDPITVSMAWIDNSDDETSFHVQRAPPLGAGQDDFQFVDIAILPANTTTYTDDGSAVPLAAGTQYDYHIFANNLGGSDGATDFLIETITDAPTDLRATGGVGQAALSWTAPSFNSATPSDLTYNVYRSTNSDGSGAQLIATALTESDLHGHDGRERHRLLLHCDRGRPGRRKRRLRRGVRHVVPDGLQRQRQLHASSLAGWPEPPSMGRGLYRPAHLRRRLQRGLYAVLRYGVPHDRWHVWRPAGSRRRQLRRQRGRQYDLYRGPVHERCLHCQSHIHRARREHTYAGQCSDARPGHGGL